MAEDAHHSVAAMTTSTNARRRRRRRGFLCTAGMIEVAFRTATGMFAGGGETTHIGASHCSAREWSSGRTAGSFRWPSATARTDRGCSDRGCAVLGRTVLGRARCADARECAGRRAAILCCDMSPPQSRPPKLVLCGSAAILASNHEGKGVNSQIAQGFLGAPIQSRTLALRQTGDGKVSAGLRSTLRPHLGRVVTPR
jgi:hypothetical protein